MLKRTTLLSTLLAGFTCISAFAAITIDGDQITFPDSSILSTAPLGSGGADRYNVVPVSAENGDTTNGSNLAAAIANIDDADWENEYVIQLDPGVYDMGTAALTMSPHIHIQGMGQQSTIIRGNGDLTLQGADRSILRSLKVQNTKSASSTVLFIDGNDDGFNDGSEFELFDVEIIHTGGGTGTKIAIDIVNGGSINMNRWNVTYEGSAGSGTFIGIRLTGYEGGGEAEGSFLEASDGILEAEDGSGAMTIVGIQVGAGTAQPGNVGDSIAIDMFAGTKIFVEGGVGKVTAIDVKSDGLAFLLSVLVAAEGEDYEDNVAINNNGGAVRTTHSTFVGDLNESSADITVYSNCTKLDSNDEFSPIINTNIALAP